MDRCCFPGCCWICDPAAAGKTTSVLQEPGEPMSLNGKTAIITGGGRGIGRATALVLAAEGCRVAVAARTETEIAGVVREIEARGGRGIAVACDVAQVEDVRRLVGRTLGEFGA